MKFGDTLHGMVSAFDDDGRGVFDVTVGNGETRTVAVPFALPGDEIEALFVKRSRGKRIGRLSKIISPSPDRVDMFVSESCLWQNLRYEKQLDAKRDAINRALTNAGHDERIASVIPSNETTFYRNRMDYCVGPRGEIGVKEYGSWNRYMDVREDRILDPRAPKILQAVRELMKECDLPGWDPYKHEGLMRYVVIRVGKNTGECMVTLIVKDLTRMTHDALRFDRPIFDSEVAQTRGELTVEGRITEALSPLCTTLYLGENPEITDLSIAKTLTLLHGKKFLTEDVNGIRYNIHPNSFFQTNTGMAAGLQDVVLNFTVGATPCGRPPTDRETDRSSEGRHGGLPLHVLDLYCGLGFFGIAAAKRGATVNGFELDAQAIELAKQNAQTNGVADQTEWTAGSVETMTDAIRALPKPDAVIVDPPRSGLHPKALQMLLDLKAPTLVYVSCNFRRLAEELKQLKTIYRVTDLRALDLFPHTPHVEVVIKFAILPS